MRSPYQFANRALCAFVAAVWLAPGVLGCRSFEAPVDLAAVEDHAGHKHASDSESADETKKAPTANESRGKESSPAEVAAETDGEPSDETSALPARPAAPMSDADADALLVLLEDNWTAEPENAPDAPRPLYRWRNPGLDDLARAPADRRADLTNFLSSEDAVVGANAAILLARANDSVADLHLVDAVRDATLKLNVRCAAAEALARPDSVFASIALAELIEEYGDGGAAHYSPELHAELLRSLGRQIDANESPQLAAGLKNASSLVRLAAVDSYAIARLGEVPRELVEMRADPYPQVRSAVLTCLVARRHAQAQDYCLAALGDAHLNVQLTAVAGLGALGGEESRRALARLAIHESESVRAAAISALAVVGDDVAVFAAAKDSSWRVRRNVARGLGRFPSERGASVARQLLADANAEVRHGVIEAVSAWSLPQAGPILLTAMADAPPPTRNQAAEQLAARWPAAGDFAPDAPPDLRRDQILRLQTAWGGASGARLLR